MKIFWKILLTGATVTAAAFALWIIPKESSSVLRSRASSPNPENTISSAVASTFVTGLEVPWSIVFTGPDRLLVAERPGRIRLVKNGLLQDAPFHEFSDVQSNSEAGLMDLALHPDYDHNKWIYAAYTTGSRENMTVKIVRLTDDEAGHHPAVTILEKIPAASIHAGTQLGFGPDRKLYISTGDAGQRSLAQDTDSLAGKILRLNDDGTIPEDNPFPNSPVYSLGHRNPQGFDWHPHTQQLYATEHGPSGFDGPGGGDELNAIHAGGNYGWPLVHHDENRTGLTAPLLTFTPAEAPASGHFYTGELISPWRNDFFFGALRGEGLWRVRLAETGEPRVIEQEKLFGNEFGRVRAVTTGPDGALYFATSNRDGRGTPQENDDRILRVAPAL